MEVKNVLKFQEYSILATSCDWPAYGIYMPDLVTEDRPIKFESTLNDLALYL